MKTVIGRIIHNKWSDNLQVLSTDNSITKKNHMTKCLRPLNK